MAAHRERRLSKRIPVKIVANCYWYRVGNDQRQEGLSYTKDLSFHGARLVIRQEVQPGTKVLIYFELPSSVVPVMAHSKIVWMRSWENCLNNHQKRFMAGVKFLRLDDFDKNRLREFLYTKKTR